MSSVISKNTLPTALSWTYSTNALTSAINLVGQIVFARLLGVEAIGKYAVVVVGVELLLLLFNFGFNQAVIKHHGNRNILFAVYTLVIIQTLGIVLASVILYFVIQAIDGINEIILLLALGYLTSKIIGLFSTLAYAPLEGDLNYRPIAISRLLSVLVGVGAGFLYIWYSSNVYSLIVRDVISAIIFLFLVRNKCPRKLQTNRSWADMRDVLIFCRPIWALNALDRGALRGDYVLAAIVLSQPEFGIYYQVRTIAEGLLGFVVNPIQTVVYSYFCRKSNRQTLYRRIVRDYYPYYTLFILGIIVVAALTPLGPYMIRVLLGEEWVAGGGMVGWLGIYMLSIILFEFTKVVAIADDKKHTVLVGRMLQLALLSVFVIPLANIYGLSGAAAASALSGVVLAVASTILLVRGATKYAG